MVKVRGCNNRHNNVNGNIGMPMEPKSVIMAIASVHFSDLPGGQFYSILRAISFTRSTFLFSVLHGE